MVVNYKDKLDLQKAFNTQRTFERFGYFYPQKAKDKISLNCVDCGKEGQLDTCDFFTRIKKKDYSCKSCMAKKWQNDKYAHGYEELLNKISSYSITETFTLFGYRYPIKTLDKIVVLCSLCGNKDQHSTGEFLSSWGDRDYYHCKRCRAKAAFEGRKENMYKGRDEYWLDPENRDKVRQRALSEHDIRSARMTASNKNKAVLKKRASSYVVADAKISGYEPLLCFFFKTLNINYIPQWKPAKFSYDVYLPAHKIVIEFDGITYHHSDPALGIFSASERQIRKSKYLADNFSSHTLIRLSELEFYTHFWLFKTFHSFIPKYKKDISMENSDRITVGRWATVFNTLKQRCDCAAHFHFAFKFEGIIVGVAAVVCINNIHAVKCWTLPGLRGTAVNLLKSHFKVPLTIENDGVLDESLEGEIILEKQVTHYKSELSGGFIAADIFQRSLFGKPAGSLIEAFKLQPRVSTIATLLLK